ncbi:beta-galactosidase [Filimonas lacunae]|uniref:Beta-galactosidase n=1 Tax=Filimonas lacunae TaxID=477680 RepID=A0A1N7RG87_9BACT|nr:glycoside hydrolase family 2 TIM barrel-domain containing protein [Filimonas lacunae]SIT34160.1 beta-galactosidase [Filimonas lacunae]
MKKIIYLFAILTASVAQAQNNALFDEGWLFYRGDTANAQEPKLNDKSWRTLNLPHDWSMEDLPGTGSPFSPDAISGVSGGFTTGGTGWYRKRFTVNATDIHKQLYLQFDGVYMNADVWLNGVHLGCHPYGYTSFWFNLAGKVKAGENVLAVRVNNEGKNSRWYSGSGIYRHVWLRAAAPVHIAQWGTVITTPQVSAENATVAVKVDVINKTAKASQVQVVATLYAPDRKVAGKATITQRIANEGKQVFSLQVPVQHPQLWNTDNPVLYTAVTEVLLNGQRTDASTIPVGIRSITYDAVKGFCVNGKMIKLQGGCVHHDNGALGAKALDRAEERRVQLLKASGFNAIRCSHNPPSPAFLDACDREGMLVIDEAFDMWGDKKNKQDYHLYFKDWWQRDVESMLYRDRNHPSIVMWSTGNEIPNRDKPEVVMVAKMLADHIRSIDNTRPVTCGVNGIEENEDPFIASLDIAGYNYARDKYEYDHQRLPQRVMFATESFAKEAFEYWREVQKHSWVIGDFVWTAFDHIGEASIGWLGYPQNKNFYPWNLAYCGDIDICGWKRPQSYYRDAVWKPNQLSLFVECPVRSFPQVNPKPEVWSKWDWKDVQDSWQWDRFKDSLLTVAAYSSCEEVELFLNDQSLGKKATDTSHHLEASWQVAYRPGVLKAVGYTAGVKVAESLLQTAGEVTSLRLTADRDTIMANNQDLSYITVELTDAKGVRHTQADNALHFSIEGPATIVAVSNANPASLESFQQPQRKAWRGRCQVVIQAGRQKGLVTIRAKGAGVQEGVATIVVR